MVSRFVGTTAAVLAGIAASMFVLSPPASAQQGVIVISTVPPANMRIERVPYGDINLLTRAGENRLHRRVSQAIERVCLYDNGRWYGLGEPDYNHCTWGAWNGARPQMTGAIYRARQLAYYRGY